MPVFSVALQVLTESALPTLFAAGILGLSNLVLLSIRKTLHPQEGRGWDVAQMTVGVATLLMTIVHLLALMVDFCQQPLQMLGQAGLVGDLSSNSALFGYPNLTVGLLTFFAILGTMSFFFTLDVDSSGASDFSVPPPFQGAKWS